MRVTVCVSDLHVGGLGGPGGGLGGGGQDQLGPVDLPRSRYPIVSCRGRICLLLYNPDEGRILCVAAKHDVVKADIMAWVKDRYFPMVDSTFLRLVLSCANHFRLFIMFSQVFPDREGMRPLGLHGQGQGQRGGAGNGS